MCTDPHRKGRGKYCPWSIVTFLQTCRCPPAGSMTDPVNSPGRVIARYDDSTACPSSLPAPLTPLIPPPPPPPTPPSPLTPLSPLPPTPSSQPPPPAAVVSLVLVAAGSVDDFDLARRTELRTRLATAAGVSVQKVTLSIEAASVRLRFSVSVEAAASTALAAALEAALPSADAASTMLGVVVLTPPLLTLEGWPPQLHRDPTPPSLNESASHVESGGDEDSSLALLLAGAGALLLAVLILVVAAVLFRRANRGRTGVARELPSTFVAIENIAQQPAIIVAGSPVVHEMGRGNPHDTELVTPNPHSRPSTSGGRDSPPPYDSKVDAGYM